MADTPRTKFDQTLDDFRERSKERILALTFTDEDAATYRDMALRMLARSQALHNPAVEAAQNANAQIYISSEKVREVESNVEASYEPLHTALRGVYYQILANDPVAGEAMARQMERAEASTNPSNFNGLGLDRTIEYSKSILTFAKIHLPAEHPLLLAFTQDVEALLQARTTLDKATGKNSEAMASLRNARDKARRLYVSARYSTAASLSIEDRDERLSSLIPPASNIYETRGGSATSDPSEPLQPSTPQPASPQLSEPTDAG